MKKNKIFYIIFTPILIVIISAIIIASVVVSNNSSQNNNTNNTVVVNNPLTNTTTHTHTDACYADSVHSHDGSEIKGGTCYSPCWGTNSVVSERIYDYVKCNTCNGYGSHLGTCESCGIQSSDKCYICDGSQKVLISCKECGTDGKISKFCSKCEGNGVIETYEDCDFCGGDCWTESIVTCACCSNDGQINCTSCKGFGYECNNCTTCYGTGKIICPICDFNNDYFKNTHCTHCDDGKVLKTTVCDSCNGFGEIVDSQKCPICSGLGIQSIDCPVCSSSHKNVKSGLSVCSLCCGEKYYKCKGYVYLSYQFVKSTIFKAPACCGGGKFIFDDMEINRVCPHGNDFEFLRQICENLYTCTDCDNYFFITENKDIHSTGFILMQCNKKEICYNCDGRGVIECYCEGNNVYVNCSDCEGGLVYKEIITLYKCAKFGYGSTSEKNSYNRHYALTCDKSENVRYDCYGNISLPICSSVVTNLVPIKNNQEMNKGDLPNFQATAYFLDGSSKVVTCDYSGYRNNVYNMAQKVILSYGEYCSTATNKNAMQVEIFITIKNAI